MIKKIKYLVLSILTVVAVDFFAFNTIRQNPEIAPSFKDGGYPEMKTFIARNLRYPKGPCFSGKVYVGFTVDTLGCIKDIEIKKSLIKDADAEAIRVVKLMTFIPGTISGKLSNMKMVIPISFTISDSD